MNFLRNLLAAIIGCLVAFGILFVMFFIFAALLGSGEDAIEVKQNTVLEMQLQGPIADYVGGDGADPFASLFEPARGLDDILHAIAVAKGDDRIKGISLNNNFVMAGMAQAQALRKALADFKEAGKFIYAYADFYTQKDYYLATVADSIFINPVGALDFKGLSSEVLFFKELQDKTGIKMEVIRHGKYKSAVEPFLENEMSEANRLQIRELIQSLWDNMLTEMAAARGLSETEMNTLADTLGGRLPKMAKNNGLLDGLVFADVYVDKLKRAVEVPDGDLELVSLEDYTRYAKTKKLKKGTDRIAVIFAQGEILYGEGGPDVIGQDLINKALKKAREDEKTKAVVLRVNSPGGSALTSDLIWREVLLTREKKPVVVSMGNVAASGGYYIASAANAIFAEPTTITGSIGVFGTVPNLSGLAADIGINAEQVGTHKNAVDYSLFEPMGDTFRNVVEESIEHTYQTFLNRVGEGRNMSMAQVDSVAQGRVWSGVDAQRVGLVDALGGLEDALAKAAELANITEYGIRKYPKYKTGLERLMEDLGGASANTRKAWLRDEMGEELYRAWESVRPSVDQKGIQAKMPFSLNIK
ncbi:signal peptide peptidase SppA [Maribacter sp. 2307ULW6-5]|uniref:signal peptide peptidase SppA n=1 Tax=Maribacter sp. 2307ULW6-5 TaxID=3386275 RepID=UPI0039BD74BF